MLLRHYYLLFAGLRLYFDTASARTIQKRGILPTPSSPTPAPVAYDGCRTWKDRLRNAIFRSDARPQVHKPTAIHPLSTYQHDIVLRFNISGREEAQAMADAVNMLYLDVWSATKKIVDIRLQQGTVPLLLNLLPQSMQNSHTRLMHNLAESALETYPGGIESPLPHPSPLKPAVETKADTLFFSDYQPWSVVLPWMKLLESLFPSHVQLITIGNSYEGREIQGLKVGMLQSNEKSERKAVVMTGAAHAREWITVSTVAYLAYAMITGFKKDDKGIDRMVNQLDWIFIPTLNVDGYIYTWEKDRLWRKNRQPTSLAFCKGIDLDRAYDFHFDNSPQSSSNPCSEMFPGSYPFQAAESKAFAEWAQNYTKDGTQEILGLLDLHSYSQQILYPYSYTCDEPPPDLENLEELGIGLAKAIRVQSGEHYEVASACEGTGFVNFPGTTGSGSMLDYFYGKLDVPFTYQIKLRDTGNYGFLLPKESIVPTGEEIFSLLKSFSQFILGDGGPTVSTSGEL